jgi:hypothetical protein
MEKPSRSWSLLETLAYSTADLIANVMAVSFLACSSGRLLTAICVFPQPVKRQK